MLVHCLDINCMGVGVASEIFDTLVCRREGGAVIGSEGPAGLNWE